MNVNRYDSSISCSDMIGNTPHFLLWFWCDVSLALTPSWTFWELLGIERLIGVFELGDLIECSCHNISNTVYSPIMTLLGHDGQITKKRRGGKMKELFLRWNFSHFFYYYYFLTAEIPSASTALITVNYFFSPWVLLGFFPASHKCCIALACRISLSLCNTHSSFFFYGCVFYAFFIHAKIHLKRVHV